MKNNKKVVALIIAVVVLAVLLAVMIPMCAKGGKEDTNPSTEATQTQSTEPQSTEPQSTEPQSTEPQSTEPQSTEPKPTEPKPTEPKPTEPKPTEPKPTEPKPTEPQPTEPKPTEPAETVQMVSTAEDLIAALKAGKNVKMTKDITVEGKTVVIPEDSNVTLDMNGKTLTANEIKEPFITTDASAFTLTGGELRITGSGNKGARALHNDFDGTMTIKNATVTSTVADASQYGMDLIVNHGKFSMSGTTVNAQRGCFSEWSNYDITITDCVFNTEKGDCARYDNAVYAVYYWAYGSMKLNNVTVNVKDTAYFANEVSEVNVVGVYSDSLGNDAISGNVVVNGERVNF